MPHGRFVVLPEQGEATSKMFREREKVISAHPHATPDQLDKLIQFATRIGRIRP